MTTHRPPALGARQLEISDASRVASALLAVLMACSSPAPAPSSPSPTQPADAGPSISVPIISCPEVATLAPPDSGACTVLQKRNFARDVAPLFNGCSGEVCHFFGSGEIAGQVGVFADECCNEIQIIDPGHPERSYLVDKLAGNPLCMGSRMPLDQPPFDANEMQIVTDWICQGADTTP
jgi:hypothetical protein